MKQPHSVQSAASVLPRRFKRSAAIAGFGLVNACRSEPQRYVLVLSHMRAGSTLLVHLLATSRSIISAGERNVPIATKRDLSMLAFQAYRMHRTCRLRRYVVDQINHAHLTPANSVLQQANVRIIILVREPRAAIASMVEVLGRYYDFDRDQAIAYYRKRLSGLSQLGQCIAERSSTPVLYLTYDQLVNSTADSLAALGNYLSLDDALSEEYPTQPYTGIRGDPSPTIMSGHVVRVPARAAAATVADQIDELEELYAVALNELATSCLGINDTSPPAGIGGTPKC